jgi:hypothetical protein
MKSITLLIQNPNKFTVLIMQVSFVLFFLVVAYRIAPGFLPAGALDALLNFSPISAIALCGAVYFRGHSRWALPLASLLVSDTILNLFVHNAPLFGVEMLMRYFAIGAASLLGMFVCNHCAMPLRNPALILSSLASSFIFYITTNAASWVTNPQYPAGVDGLIQALTTGIPGYPSTLWFYRQTILGDLAFTALVAASVSIANFRMAHRLAKHPLQAA